MVSMRGDRASRRHSRYVYFLTSIEDRANIALQVALIPHWQFSSPGSSTLSPSQGLRCSSVEISTL
jgi:hypothetical protein